MILQAQYKFPYTSLYNGSANITMSNSNTVSENSATKFINSSPWANEENLEKGTFQSYTSKYGDKIRIENSEGLTP